MQASRAHAQKEQKGTSPVFVLTSSTRTHAIVAHWEAWHELSRPKLLAPQDRDLPEGGVQQKAWKV